MRLPRQTIGLSCMIGSYAVQHRILLLFLFMYIKRSRMLRAKDPGPYDDKMGPIVLCSMLALSIVINFFVKMYDLST